MATSADPLMHRKRSFSDLVRSLRHELAPHHGRTAIVARMVFACVVTMLLVMTFKLPYGFLAVFYALAIARENPHATVRNGFRIILANLAGTAVLLIGVILFIDHPLSHFLFVAACFFLVFFVTRTSLNFSVAFGFGIMLIAGACLIWARPNPAELRLETTIGTAFGIILGTLVTVLSEWLLAPAANPHGGTERRALFVSDAFSNPEHLVFALKGCLAGSLCYAVWTALAWPGLGECTITCVIVAPAVPGSSRRKLAIRIAGMLVGGLIFGVGSQVWILPLLDSITGFTLAFAAVSAIAAWFTTASPRLSYFGRQVALAYYITIFQGFGVRTPLAVIWSPQMGILLGLLVMWLVFDVRWKARTTTLLGATMSTRIENIQSSALRQ